MSTDTPRLLVCTNGSETGLPAVEYGIWLGKSLNLEVTLLGIMEHNRWGAEVEAVLEDASRKLEGAGVPYQSHLRKGRSGKIIAEHTRQGIYLTVFGALGRSAWSRWIRGRSFRRILEQVETPLVYTRVAHLQMKRILICLGGLGYALDAEDVSLYLARQFEAALTLLHVVEPITYDYPTSQEVKDHWEDILQTDTPQGHYLRLAIERAEEGGLQTNFQVRHGHVVHEILAELDRADYDLVAMGSHYSTHSLRQLYLPNITAEVADSIDCPVLTVRSGSWPAFDGSAGADHDHAFRRKE